MKNLKLLSIILSFLLILNTLTVIGFALPATDTVLIDENFENSSTANWVKNMTTDAVTSTECAIVDKSEAVYAGLTTITPEDGTNKVLAVNNGKAIYTAFLNGQSVNSGKMTMECDIQPGNGGVFFGLIYENGYGLAGKYPLVLYRNYKRFGSYSSANPSANTTNLFDYKYNSAYMNYTAYNWVHAKLALDFTAQTAVLSLNGNESAPVSIDYFGGANTAVRGIGVYSTRTTTVADQIIYIDNLKVTVPASSIKEVIGSSKTVRIEFADAISTITKDDISIKDENGFDVAINSVSICENSKYCVAILDRALTDNAVNTITISSNIKYADGYNVLAESKKFTSSDGGFTCTASFDKTEITAGETVSAVCEFTNTDLLSHSGYAILAAYDNGNNLLGIKLSEYNYSAEDYGNSRITLGLAIPQSTVKLKTFVWDSNIRPLMITSSLPE